MQHEHNGLVEFCQQLRTNTARICEVRLFNGDSAFIYAEAFEGKIPEQAGMTVGESDNYRKLHLNTNKEMQKEVMLSKGTIL